jgi:hypothetical protein
VTSDPSIPSATTFASGLFIFEIKLFKYFDIYFFLLGFY